MADTILAPVPTWPLFGWADDVRLALAQASARGATAVLATLHAVVGGSPRPVGSQMLVCGGELHGFLSGGCIEGDVAQRAEEVLACGSPQRLVYGEGGPFADIRLVCGGRIEVLLERIAPNDPAVAGLLQARDERRPVLWVSDGLERLCLPSEGAAPTPLLPGRLVTALEGLAAPEVGCVSVDAGQAVALRCLPAPQVVVVGHDPIALAIASFAAQSGYDTHLIRPKGPQAPPPLPGVQYHRATVADAMAAIGLDAWTYVVIATHALEEDEEALVAALPSPAPYVGLLGAKRRLPERLVRLRARGLSDEALARLHAPIGLDIGGKAPFEVAVAVLAEIVSELSRHRPRRGVVVDRQAAVAA